MLAGSDDRADVGWAGEEGARGAPDEVPDIARAEPHAIGRLLAGFDDQRDDDPARRVKRFGGLSCRPARLPRSPSRASASP